jgi:hypothetical protein
MPLVTNALCAAPSCAISRCSFDDLRLTTLFAALLLFLATFLLVRVLQTKHFASCERVFGSLQSDRLYIVLHFYG